MTQYLFLLSGGGAEGGDSPFALITPDPGLFLWSVIIFGLLWLILAKVAFKPIAQALRNREESISDALKSAERARAEVAELKNENEEILKQAREERSQILKEANELKAKTIAEAKEQAQAEGEKMLANARQEIINEKAKAMAEVKAEVGSIAAEIAEKLVKKNLSNTQEQQDLIASLVKESNFN